MLIEDRDWPAPDERQDAYLELKTREVRSLVRTEGCRRAIIGRCLDGDVWDCKAIEAVLCDNCRRHETERRGECTSQGLVLSQAYGRRVARGLERIQCALEEIEELGMKEGCRICWMFYGERGAQHSWWTCQEAEECLSFQNCMRFQRTIDYRRDKQARFLSCFHCHVSQELCRDGYKDGGTRCRWKHVIIPVALAATTEEEVWKRVQGLAGREFKGEADYGEWLGRKHSKLVCGQEMTNAMAVFELVVRWRVDRGV